MMLFSVFVAYQYTYHLGTQTLDSVGVLDNDVRPCEGNRFHVITFLMVSWKNYKGHYFHLLQHSRLFVGLRGYILKCYVNK